jgi:hypothetical protein
MITKHFFEHLRRFAGEIGGAATVTIHLVGGDKFEVHLILALELDYLVAQVYPGYQLRGEADTYYAAVAIPYEQVRYVAVTGEEFDDRRTILAY